MSGRRSVQSSLISGTSNQPQVRVLGLIIISACLAVLSIAAIFFPTYPVQAMAAIVTVMIGTAGFTYAYMAGLITFIAAPFNQNDTTRLFFTVIIGLATCIGLELFIITLAPMLPEPLVSFSSVLFVGGILSVSVSPFEEMLCRGLFQTLIIRLVGPRFGPVFGICGGGLIFGVFHFRVYGISPAFWVMVVVGVVIGICYYVTPYLEVPILIHMLLNFAAVIPL